MKQLLRLGRSLPWRFVAGTGLAFLLPISAQTQTFERPHTLTEISAQVAVADATSAAPDGGTAQAQVMSLDLATCLSMAMERQPRLAAARASLAAAEEGSRAVNNIKVPSFIVRELPVRRKQACLGVIVASAALDQAERETVYAVTRTFHSVLYAREQLKVTGGVVDHLKATSETAQRLVQGGSREVTTSSSDKIIVYLRLAETRKAEAAHGVERATAALREAIGLDPEVRIQVVDAKLPEPTVKVVHDQIIALALSRRGELVQASNGAEVACLEVEAQGTSCKPSFHTYASASDIHANPIPQGIANGEYRPGAIGPEMPTSLVGSKKDRMNRARALSARAGAVVDKTRNLIALEAEDAFLRWEEVAEKVPQSREAAEKATKLADDTRKDFGGEQKVKVEDVLANEVLAAQARATHNEALYQQALALAALERVTAGGFHAGLAAPSPERLEH